MKYIATLFLTFLFLSNTLFAQVPQAGDYITNSNIDKFVGTWQWTSGNDVLIIKLKKVKFLNSNPAYHDDVLFGCHTYIKSGVIIESSMDDFNLVGPARKGTINIWNLPDESSVIVKGGIKDISKDKFGKLTLEYTSGTPPEIMWKLETEEGGNFLKSPGLTLPRNVTLIKQ